VVSNETSRFSRPVLVVDDEFYVTKAISYRLQEEGLKCIAKNNSDGIVKLVDEENPLVVILDVNMPKINGFTICKELRENPKYQDISILLLTARGQQEDIDKGMKLGATEYILKPFNPLELRDKIKAIYQNHQA